jgi:hypothetical protein
MLLHGCLTGIESDGISFKPGFSVFTPPTPTRPFALSGHSAKSCGAHKLLGRLSALTALDPDRCVVTQPVGPGSV